MHTNTKSANLDVPDDLTVALSNELNLHLEQHNVETHQLGNKTQFEIVKNLSRVNVVCHTLVRPERCKHQRIKDFTKTSLDEFTWVH